MTTVWLVWDHSRAEKGEGPELLDIYDDEAGADHEKTSLVACGAYDEDQIQIEERQVKV